MKTNRTLTLIAGLLFSSLLFFSCQKEKTSSLISSENSEVLKSKATVSTSENLVTSGVSAGSYFTYSANNVCPGTTVTVTFSNTQGKDCGDFHMQMWGPNDIDWVNVTSSLSAPSGGTVSYTFVANDLGDYRFRGQWIRTGSPTSCSGDNTGWQEANPKLSVVECCPFTGEAFSGEAISCGTSREAIYKFSSKDGVSYFKMQGGLTNFTGADAVVTVTGGNLTKSQWTPGGASNRIIKVEGSVAACEEITINIKWNSTNSGGIITGAWSVKDASGIEVAPSIAGLECQ